MWPDTKKFSVLMTYRNEVTSRNQNPTMPIAVSKKKPMRKPSSSEAT